MDRRTVTLDDYPDLVVIYLGMYVRKPRGMLRLLGLGPQIQKSWQAEPDGLLLHENLIWSLIPPHAGMRQYWRDLDSLERWTRSEPHRRWWLDFARDTGGTGFWHEAYFMRGGIDAIYDDVSRPLGLGAFAPVAQARGRMFSARRRAGRQEAPVVEPLIAETELYADAETPTPSP
jgi:Monooxygenase af470-like